MSEVSAFIIEAAQALERRPSMPARLLAALPLFTLFFIYALYMLVAPRFEQAFREMDLGGLPAVTECFLAIGRFGRDFYYLMGPGMFALAYAYFVWGCVTGRRMMWFACAMGMLAFIMTVFAVLAYVLPLMEIFDRIGK